MPDDRYAWLVRRVWEGIERCTGMPPCYLDRNHIGAYCPVGCGGTLAIGFLDPPSGPEAVVETHIGAGNGHCSRGCDPKRILGALLR